MKRLLSILMVTFLFALPSQTDAEGKLNAFEESATGDSGTASGRKKRQCDEHDDNSSFVGEIVGEIFGELLGALFRIGAENSLYNADQINYIGDPILPALRCDFVYQNVESDVYAYDLRLEGGYGPLALHYNLTRYNELNPDDHLDLHRLFLMYRVAIDDDLEIDLGFGTLDIDGNEHHSKFCFTMPMIYRASENLSLEIRPAWADRVTDWDFSARINNSYASLKLGYRIVDAPSESLNGPYIGLSFYY